MIKLQKDYTLIRRSNLYICFDLLVTLEEKSLKEISNFVSDKLSTLDRVLSTSTHFILKKYKDHGTIVNKTSEEEMREIITP